MQRQSSILGSLIFAVIFITAGYMAYKHVTKPIAEEASASEQWPTVMGEITNANIKTSKSSEGTIMYAPDVNYTYQVDGKQFKGHKISMMDGSTSMQSSVKSTLKTYAKGKQVTVFYDPELPSIAVLEPGKSFWINFILYGPLTFCFIGVLVALNSLKRLLRFVLT